MTKNVGWPEGEGQNRLEVGDTPLVGQKTIKEDKTPSLLISKRGLVI